MMSPDQLKMEEQGDNVPTTKKPSTKILTTPRMERCIGCHACSLACARLVNKKLSWDTAGIRIVSSGGLSTGFESKPCLACDPAPCALACPTGAFSQRKDGGVRVKRKLCIQCGDCAQACLQPSIEVGSDRPTDGSIEMGYKIIW